MFGALYEAGYVGELSIFLPSLPAAAQNTTPFFPKFLIALFVASS